MPDTLQNVDEILAPDERVNEIMLEAFRDDGPAPGCNSQPCPEDTSDEYEYMIESLVPGTVDPARVVGEVRARSDSLAPVA